MHYFSIQTAAKNILVKIKPYRKREPPKAWDSPFMFFYYFTNRPILMR